MRLAERTNAGGGSSNSSTDAPSLTDASASMSGARCACSSCLEHLARRPRNGASWFANPAGARQLGQGQSRRPFRSTWCPTAPRARLGKQATPGPRAASNPRSRTQSQASSPTRHRPQTKMRRIPSPLFSSNRGSAHTASARLASRLYPTERTPERRFPADGPGLACWRRRYPARGGATRRDPLPGGAAAGGD